MDKVTNKNKQNQLTSSPPSKKEKLTQEEQLNLIEIKSIEKDCLDRVFKMLSKLQELPSSDDETAQKIYKRQIEAKANQKKMKISVKNSNKSSPAKVTKLFKEDEDRNASQLDELMTEKKGRISVKAVRKILTTLCSEFPKEEMEMMIWEVDENLDGYICEKEFEKMYKRCITDEKEQQPKKLFYLVQFLMYDKEEKHFITEEDTLEILYIRHGDKFNQAIDAIFDIEEISEKGEIKRKGKRDRLTFVEYAERMHILSMRKRDKTTNKRKIFCEKVQNEWKMNKGTK